MDIVMLVTQTDLITMLVTKVISLSDSNWLLRSGTWDDSGEWVDSAVWVD